MKITAGWFSRPASVFAKAMPSMPGIWMSSSRRSGLRLSIRRSALPPSAAVPATAMPGMPAQRSCSRSMASGSSSTIKVRSASLMALGEIAQKRQSEIGAEAAAFAGPEGDAGRAVEAGGEPVAHIGQAHAIGLGKAQAGIGIVFHGEVERAAIGAGADGDGDGAVRLGHAMLDGVLHQGLEDHAGHASVFQILGHIHLHGEAVGKANLLDIEIKL